MAIIIVSGLPRTGTSLMMQMLAAGGLPVLTDDQRAADLDNPKGYYEYERVKRLRDGDTAWLEHADGRAVKIVSVLLPYLPASYTYRVVFMQRRLDEILASQRVMLSRRGQPAPDAAQDARLAQTYALHLEQTRGWLSSQPNVTWLEVSYNLLLAQPVPVVAAVGQFLGSGLDTRRMPAAVDRSLYHQQSHLEGKLP